MKPNLITRLFLALSALQIAGCAADPPPAETFKHCLYGAPEPIFDDRVSGISNHSFVLQPGKGVETFTLMGSTRVKIEQTGCDHIHQAFTFEWEGSVRRPPSGFWADAAVRRYEELGSLGASFLSFQAISEVLERRKPDLQPGGPPIALQPGLLFQLNPQSSGGPTAFTALLYETDED